MTGKLEGETVYSFNFFINVSKNDSKIFSYKNCLFFPFLSIESYFLSKS